MRWHAPSQTQTVLSRLQLAKSVPELEYETLLHSVSCPSNKLAHSHSPPPPRSSPSSSLFVSCSHIPMFESNEAVASVFPDGAHASARTVLLCPVGIVVMCENRRSGGSAELLGPYEYNRTDLSAEQEASNGLVGFHAMCHVRSSCPG
jgi:hypothetical protein